MKQIEYLTPFMALSSFSLTNVLNFERLDLSPFCSILTFLIRAFSFDIFSWSKKEKARSFCKKLKYFDMK